MAVALLTIKLKHVDWRNGRPMFKPAGRLYRLGFKAKALRHYAGGAPGPWFTLDECRAFVERVEGEIAAARKERPLVAVPGTARRQLLYSLDRLIEDFLASPAAASLRRSSYRDYRGKARVLQAFDSELCGCAAAALDKAILFNLYERLAEEKGVAQARGVMVVLSAALSWAILRGHVKFPADQNPAHRLKMKTPKPRLRVGEISEMRALVAAADALGRPDVGDAIVLGLWTGQRQGDRLALVDDGLVQGRRIFRQAKTGAVVAIREAPELEARLAAMRERRAAWPVADLKPLVVMDETARAPFKGDWYRHCFAEVREAAVSGVALAAPVESTGAPATGARASAEGGANGEEKWQVPPCPSLSTFRDQDLRDTAVTWMALAGATVPEIIAVTGHTPGQAADILRHYLGRHPELADAAIGKMAAWYERSQG